MLRSLVHKSTYSLRYGWVSECDAVLYNTESALLDLGRLIAKAFENGDLQALLVCGLR